MLKCDLPLNNSLLATSLAKSRLFSARTLYRTICQKLTALNSPRIRRDIASDIRPYKKNQQEDNVEFNCIKTLYRHNTVESWILVGQKIFYNEGCFCTNNLHKALNIRHYIYTKYFIKGLIFVMVRFSMRRFLVSHFEGVTLGFPPCESLHYFLRECSKNALERMME